MDSRETSMDGIYILASTTKSDFAKFIDTTSSNAGKDRWRFPVEIHTLTHVQPNFLALRDWPVRVHAYLLTVDPCNGRTSVEAGHSSLTAAITSAWRSLSESQKWRLPGYGN